MHIAILGGTFNPVHYGHLRGAEEAREELSADKVLFIPTALPPHKTPGALAPAGARLRMLGEAVKRNPLFDVSDIEIKRGGRSYTIDTLRELMALHGEAAELTLIIGSDSFNELRSWFKIKEIVSIASIAVFKRPGVPAKEPGEALPVELADDFCYDLVKGYYTNSSGKKLIFLDSTLLDISSTAIRKMACAGRSLGYIVPHGVIDIILNERLYAAEEV